MLFCVCIFIYSMKLKNYTQVLTSDVHIYLVLLAVTITFSSWQSFLSWILLGPSRTWSREIQGPHTYITKKIVEIYGWEIFITSTTWYSVLSRSYEMCEDFTVFCSEHLDEPRREKNSKVIMYVQLPHHGHLYLQIS